MSFLFLMIKIALVIYVVKFFWNTVVGALWLWLKLADKSEAQAVANATVKEVK